MSNQLVISSMQPYILNIFIFISVLLKQINPRVQNSYKSSAMIQSQTHFQQQQELSKELHSQHKKALLAA